MTAQILPKKKQFKKKIQLYTGLKGETQFDKIYLVHYPESVISTTSLNLKKLNRIRKSPENGLDGRFVNFVKCRKKA